MKNKFLVLALLLITLSAFRCEKEKLNSTCYKGKLVKKGICMNYTISLVNGNMDPSLYEASWTDPNTGTTYQKAFALGSPCGFPENINEGDEFYFEVESSIQNCVVCQAFYPTPNKSVQIKVLSSSCP